MAEKKYAIKEETKKFIIDNYLLGSSKAGLSDNDSFLEKGIIDSIGVIELTGFLQSRYNIKIKPTDIVPENLDTLNNIEAFVTKKLK